jgi:hypothetical protein
MRPRLQAFHVRIGSVCWQSNHLNSCNNQVKIKRKKDDKIVPNKKTARFAGLLFLLMVVTGLFAEIFFRQKLFSNDIAKTADNILRNDFLYRAGIMSDIIMSLCYLFTALALYKLLVTVNKDMANLVVLFAAAGCVLLFPGAIAEIAFMLWLLILGVDETKLPALHA